MIINKDWKQRNNFKNLTTLKAYKKGISIVFLNYINKNGYLLSVAKLPESHKFNNTNKPLYWVVINRPYFEGYLLKTKRELYKFIFGVLK